MTSNNDVMVIAIRQIYNSSCTPYYRDCNVIGNEVNEDVVCKFELQCSKCNFVCLAISVFVGDTRCSSQESKTVHFIMWRIFLRDNESNMYRVR